MPGWPYCALRVSLNGVDGGKGLLLGRLRLAESGAVAMAAFAVLGHVDAFAAAGATGQQGSDKRCYHY